ncbi:GNAT family N-acetyltransferase [Catellatospora sp. KI3]|uniref:GNAT family N-acetyltransferase n=1 Tax=Catellatospora sp. KI3 TaxID=3041620 RepID=UPI0024826E16|nr:GNAT family N-acetyltransferase [Catellatospora sp. KI3]MDI1463194.1 GNAT family N-acetyltransferase [Catellatospora sp. KI3]
MIEIPTERLILRDWRETDLPAWAAINADPEVREHLGPVWDEARSAASIAHYQEEHRRNGFGFWAVEQRDRGELIGFAGLDVIDPDMPFQGVEIGWRLARSAWGHGYASEAALAVLKFGFETAGLDEILAITVAAMSVRRRSCGASA